MLIERVVHVSEPSKKAYDKTINELIKKFKKAGFDYDVIESRYNSKEHGYRAEVQYSWWYEGYDYDC